MSPFERRTRPDLPGILPKLFVPVLALGAVTAAVALLAGLLDWYPHRVLVSAGVVGAAVVAVTLALFYRKRAEHLAATLALHNIEARVGGIVASAMDAIVAVDESQRIVLFNAAAEKVFRWPQAAVLGQPLDMLIPERLRADHHGHIERFGQTGATSRRMGSQTVLVALRSSGEEFPIEASISQHVENGKKTFTVILRDVTERVRAEDALRRSREELRELAQAANSVREQEKSRIARELHDELAQALTALKMDVNWIADRSRKTADEPLGEKLAAMQAMLDDTVAATRRISADLRPLMLDDLGLVPAVEWLVQGFTERSGIHCDLKLAEEGLELGEPYASAVFRILQESLTNVAKHAQASRVEMSVARRDGVVALTVRDNGRGFAPENPRKPNSFGLMGLRERAYALGGSVEVWSREGEGTKIDVRIPVSASLLREAAGR